MKKILVLGVILVLQTSAFASSYVDKQLKEAKKNQQRNSVQIHKVNYAQAPQIKKAQDIKDPKLIKLSDYKPVSEKDYSEKLAKDEQVYKNKIKPIINKNLNSVNVAPSSVDFYNVYRVSERIIRANNLDYVNWRIAIRKSEDVNADSSMANLVRINTALFDALYGDDDALAFVIAHEMAHLVLNHTQRQAELIARLIKLADYNKGVITSRDLYLTGNAVVNIQAGRILSQVKMMEFMADTEALILVTKAGYSPYKAVGALNFLKALPGANVRTFYDTHPMINDRIKSANENISYTNPDWVNEGKANIFNSDVLDCKKSSDRVSIVIMKSEKNKNFYQPEDITKRLTRIAYTSYLKGDMENAVKYFEKLNSVEESYITCLYLSYANEYLYNTTQKEKYLKEAKKYIEKASALNSNDENVNAQKNSLL